MNYWRYNNGQLELIDYKTKKVILTWDGNRLRDASVGRTNDTTDGAYLLIKELNRVKSGFNKGDIYVTTMFDWFGVPTTVTTLEVSRKEFNKALKWIKRNNRTF